MGDDNPFEVAATQMTAVIHGLNQMLEPIQEAASGYREEMKRRGFNEASANEMAVHYHATLMEIMRNQAFSAKR